METVPTKTALENILFPGFTMIKTIDICFACEILINIFDECDMFKHRLLHLGKGNVYHRNKYNASNPITNLEELAKEHEYVLVRRCDIPNIQMCLNRIYQKFESDQINMNCEDYISYIFLLKYGSIQRDRIEAFVHSVTLFANGKVQSYFSIASGVLLLGKLPRILFKFQKTC